MEERGPLFYLVCMFNSFHLKGGSSGLSIGSIRTWSKDEIRESLTSVLGDAGLANHFSQGYEVNELNIGVGELIAGWSAVITMPRRKVYGGLYQSVFSASSLGCTFGVSELSKLLLQARDEGTTTLNNPDEGDPVLNFLKIINTWQSAPQ